jgi:hypothetical protein
MGGRAEGLACADPGARTPIDASKNYLLRLWLGCIPKISFLASLVVVGGG